MKGSDTPGEHKVPQSESYVVGYVDNPVLGDNILRFEGVLQELRIWSRALSIDELKATAGQMSVNEMCDMWRTTKDAILENTACT